MKRTGWIDNNVKEPESVADHMYRMAMMTFLLNRPNNGIDTTRLVSLASFKLTLKQLLSLKVLDLLAFFATVSAKA